MRRRRRSPAEAEKLFAKMLAPRRVVLGIDPGLQGAVAHHTEDGWIAANLPAKDGEKIDTLLTAVGATEGNCVIYLERLIFVPTNSAKTIQAAGINYGRLLECIRRTGAELRIVDPNTWRAAMSMTRYTKEQVHAVVSHLAAPGLTKRNADAVAIAEYGRRDDAWRRKTKRGKPCAP